MIIRLIILRNKLTPSCTSEKKVISPEFGQKKNSSPNQITHSPSQKSNGRPLTILLYVKLYSITLGKNFLATSVSQHRACTDCETEIARSVLLYSFLKSCLHLFFYLFIFTTDIHINVAELFKRVTI